MLHVFKTTPASERFYEHKMFKEAKEYEEFVKSLVCVAEDDSDTLPRPDVLFYGYARTTFNTIFVKRSSNTFLFPLSPLAVNNGFFPYSLNIDGALIYNLKVIFQCLSKVHTEESVRHTHPTLNGVVPMKEFRHFVILYSLVFDSKYYANDTTLNLGQFQEVPVDWIKPNNHITTLALESFVRVKETA